MTLHCPEYNCLSDEWVVEVIAHELYHIGNYTVAASCPICPLCASTLVNVINPPDAFTRAFLTGAGTKV